MKDTGKSSSRKLRRVVYYLLYRTDPQKTHYKNSCSANISQIKQHENARLYFPPNSRSTAPLRPLSGSIGDLWQKAAEAGHECRHHSSHAESTCRSSAFGGAVHAANHTVSKAWPIRIEPVSWFGAIQRTEI